METKENLSTTFNEQEKKVRKRWLITWIINVCLFLCFFIVMLYVIISAKKFSFDHIVGGIIALSAVPILPWLSYHCAYKKHGVVWITIELILIALIMIEYILTPNIFDFLISLPFLAWVFYIDIQLRKINKKIRSASTKNSIEPKQPE